MTDSNRVCLEQFVSELLYVELVYDSGLRRYVVEVYPQLECMKREDYDYTFRTKFFAYRKFRYLEKLVRDTRDIYIK